MPTPKPKPKKSEEFKAQETMKQKSQSVNIPKVVKPKPTGTLTGSAAIEQYKKETSPSGIASSEAAAKKAIEEKYPGMFIPSTRRTPGLRRP